MSSTNILATIIAAPLTSNMKPDPTAILIRQPNQGSMLALGYIRTRDKSRIVESFFKLSKVEIQKCKAIIKETFFE